jgi:hypothetical protein
MFFDYDSFMFLTALPDGDFPSGGGTLSLDPNAPPQDYEIDFDNIRFGDEPEYPDAPPSFVNGGEFDMIVDFMNLVANDPNINAVLDEANLVYLGNLEFGSDVSYGDLIDAFIQSMEDFYYYDFMFMNDYENDFSYQYNYDDEVDGYIKEYV